ncbi:Beta-lactamase 3 [Fusarium agapanthi]|uniref:Beta-lactamase 3 n=1 Tax=Fusarium agapanthi TaxID=1803897 RepID=A0A9P5B1L0_9HYPO|nr:Beta-lactamase 3 [Fusarium agapanthi]
MQLSYSIVSILSLKAHFTSAELKCRPEGAVLPRPTALTRSPIFTAAATNLTETLNAALSGSITAGWPTSNVSFSLAVYLPGLDGKSKIQWRDVSLRMLASYLAGTPANYGFSDFYWLKEVFLAHGLPPIDDDDYPPCGVVGLNKGCTGEEIVPGMKESYPQTTPNERPAYSNMAFILLGIALEEYTVHHAKAGFRVLNVFSAGGLVSSLSDISKFSHALLSRTLNMTSTEINGWLKPSAFAGNAYTLTGMPWEILRLSNLTPDHPHTVTVYGKGGGAQNYRSQLSFVDDYGLAIIILTAGPMKAAPVLTNAMLSTFVEAADEVSREQAKRYERRYMSDHEDDVPIEAALEQDNDSMILASLHRSGTDVLSRLTDIWGLTLGDFLPGVGPKIRVFPSQLRENVTLDGKPVMKEVWHSWPDLNSGFETDLPGNEIEDMNCVGWSIQDWVHYGGEPLDRVLVYVGEHGDVRGFEVPFLRSGILHPIQNDKKT